MSSTPSSTSSGPAASGGTSPTSFLPGALLFGSGHRTPLDAQNVVNRGFKPLLQRAGCPDQVPQLRHSCLSLLASRGAPIRNLQALAEHATAGFTLKATPTITTHRPAALPTRWATYSPTNPRPLRLGSKAPGPKPG